MRVTLNGIMRKGLLAWKGRRQWRDQKVRIWSGEHGLYWRPNASGYTSRPEGAWVLDFADAFSRTRHCGPEKRITFERV